MGFFRGLRKLGGVTLTAGALYTGLLLHRQNRATQASLIRQQTDVLNNVVEPTPRASVPVEREAPGGIAEQFKDGWNRELSNLIRRAQSLDWGLLREEAESVINAGVKSLRRLGEGKDS